MDEDVIQDDLSSPEPNPEDQPRPRRSDRTRQGQELPYVSKGKLVDSIELLTAAKKEDFATVQKILLASKELDLDQTDEVEKTTLHYLSNFARADEITKCLERKVDVNKMDKLGWTALHYAALKDHAAVAQLLINHGADCNVRDKQQGRTPLFYAVSRDNRGVVELLLENGADPTVRDNQNKQPVDVCKNEMMKSILEAAVQKMEEQKQGAVSETVTVSMDKPTPFSQLGLTVDPRTSPDPANDPPVAGDSPAFKMAMKRTSPTNCATDFGIAETEDICSAVFTYLVVGECPACLPLTLSVPVSSPPSRHEEAVLKTDTGREIAATEVTEEEERWFCHVTADLMTFRSFVVVCRARTERFQVGAKACTIRSAVDDRVEMDIPKGTFNTNVTLTMEITDPLPQEPSAPAIQQCPDLRSTTAFYTLDAGGHRLNKPVSVKVPLSPHYQGSSNLLILSMDDSPENEKPESWRVISSGPRLHGQLVEFDVSSFSIKVAVETASTISEDSALELERSLSVLSQISRVFRRARRKEYQALFTCFTRRMGTTNTFKVVVECSKENQLNARAAFWEAEGFERQGADNNASPLTVRAKEKFSIQPHGLNVVGKKDALELQFHPKLDNVETFLVRLEEGQQVSLGSLEVWKVDGRQDSTLGDSADHLKTEAVKLNVKLLKFDPRSLGQDKSFLSYQRVSSLIEAIGDRWWKVLLLIGVSFQTIDRSLQNNPGNVEEKINALMFDWRERRRDDRSRGLPLLLAALGRSGLMGVAKNLQVELRRWKDRPDNRADSFRDWLLMAYKFDLLVPTVYETPMSDGFLAMLADQMEPNLGLAAALSLPEGIVRDILAKTHVYPTKGLQTMKMLDIFRVGISDKQGALTALAAGLGAAGLTEQRSYVIMGVTSCAIGDGISNANSLDLDETPSNSAGCYPRYIFSNFGLKKVGQGDPMAADMERFLARL